MTYLLHPAIWLSARFNFRWKLFGTFLLFAIPLTAATALLVLEARHSLARIDRQREGLALQLPLLGLVRSVQDHYAASLATIHGEVSMGSRMAATRIEFERGAPAVLGHRLAGDQGAQIARQWQALTATPPTDADASRNAHEGILDDLFRLRETFVDQSGLSLNDDAGTQVLTDLLNTQLVPLIQNLGQARDVGVGVGVIARGRISMSQREAMSIVRGSFDTLLTWMDRSVEKIGVIRPELKGALAEPLATLNGSALGVQEYLTTKLINTSDFDIAPASYHAKGSAALEAGIAFAARLIPGIDQLMATREQETRSAFQSALLAFAIAVALIAYLFAGAYTSILRSIHELEVAARAMAAGDLRARVMVRTHDEIGHVGNGFNAMAESFSALIAKVAGAAGNTRSAASELTDQVAQVTAASARQSESAARSSSSVQALAVSVQQVATHAEDTNRITRQAAELSADGRAIADQAAAGMQCIVDDIAAAVAAVLALEERSRTIDRVAYVIAEIAEQTNLLALNAAIEAARAGEVGRGFAVVADEVRKLANRTGSSTREIAATIREMRNGIQDVVAGIRQGSARVGESSVLFAKVLSALDAIHYEVTRSAMLVGDIVSVTRAQTDASHDIARSIETMAVMADENHGTARRTGTAISDLLQLSDSLRVAIAELRV
ncbi:methyl-accepting chemotaxis protein [Aromatoleum aromaticum]|uniref:Probable membrane-associated methyl-accepting chemotaxis protein with HAMP domain n=2 Tax=Aromatoleum aromaticum TaxID=551760 RepID=Q5NZ36_AROAE|nr:methyl-accepting chemotaxis protein [Aromatoleum aromaticum]NMG55618.1 HAMP domain-containing protein [Aromatoleum aromaticum]CAI09678.1 probable membrane-associated methyl-accepting chemotaxis protein with HAMP domain [Aromatoleum aromaticum EbN1]